MKKIMIVDDEKISLAMTNHILATEYQTICAASGEEAIELYHSEHPDMVLSDLRMPGMTGFELQQRLQAEGVSVPFMFMTADKNDDTEAQGFAIGAQDFIRKPFRADVLLRRVDIIISNAEKIQGLRKAAVTDPMTGLLNKASSQEEIDNLCRTTPGVLMMIDLDSFKPVNDIYGHDMGDKVLLRFAEIIRSAVRTTDLTGRIGGDEFIAYCANISDEDVIAEKVRYINEQVVAAAKELMGEDMSIPLGASVGCAFSPDEGKDFQTLYKKADKALYDVKQNGKHGYRFYHESSERTESADSQVSSIINEMRILAERSPSKGAFLLPYEKFRTIYQFLSRVVVNYQEDVYLLYMTLRRYGSDEMPAQEVSEAFTGVLRSCLRQSDVLTQSGDNHFLVLLFGITSINLDTVVNRILTHWESTDSAEYYGVDYEMEILKS